MIVLDPPAQPGFEMLLARYTWTATGDPLTLAQARTEFGPQVQPWTRLGWFWKPATAVSAARIRADGHRACGSAITTWIPPQTGPQIIDAPEPSGDHRAVVWPAQHSEPA